MSNKKTDPSARPAQWLSLQDAAARYGVCVKTLRRAIVRGDLKAGRLGSRVIRVRINDLDDLFKPIPSVRAPQGRCNDRAALKLDLPR